MDDFNNYSKDNQPIEVSYYPADVDDRKNKKHIGLKIFGGLICAAAISIGSIGCYASITGNGGNYFTQDGNISSINSNEGNTAVTEPLETEQAKDLSFIQLSSKENALTIPEIIKKVNPSVVGVTSLMSSGTATGTGIIISQDGYIITNAHVVRSNGVNAKAVNVILDDKSEYSAQIIGCDSKTDLAVLKIEKTGLTAAEFGDSDDLEVGELAIAIGNPLGLQLSGSVSHGIISALNREITIEDTVMNLIQTDAAINPGNSGGPLVNCYGQVIGINSAKISMEEVEGIGFAIPIDSAIPIVNDLINNGYVTGRPQIGITGQDISSIESRYYGLPQGILVRFVEADSGASKSGIQVGDIIISADGTDISTMSELNIIKDKFKPGDTISMTIYRNGVTNSLQVTLTEAKN